MANSETSTVAWQVGSSRSDRAILRAVTWPGLAPAEPSVVRDVWQKAWNAS